MRLVGSKVRLQLPSSHAPGELGGPAAPKVGAFPALRAGGELAVEEDRDAECGDVLGDLAGDRARVVMALVGMPDDRRDVKGANVWMEAVVATEVDQVEGVLGSGHQGLDELVGLGGDRVDAAVVLRVEVAVEDTRVAGEGRLEGIDHSLASPLRELRYRHQRNRPPCASRLCHLISNSPSCTIASPSSSRVGFVTMQSRWTGTWTVPPIPAEAPKATWIVPAIFSSSRISPVSFALSFVRSEA